MDWNEDMVFEVQLTPKAERQAQRILDYIFYELENAQAAYSVEQDMKATIKRLAGVAGSLKLCDDPELRAKGLRTIHLERHRYFMLYTITDKRALVIGIYHDLQDYENALR